MIKFLARIFIKDRENYTDARVRRAYGALCSVVGVCLNVLLFAGKYAVGVLSGSIAVTADAFNNLSDAGSSVITLLGFRMAAKKPDVGHPFGHGRIEYLSGVAVSVMIIVVGFELGRNAVSKILTPQAVDANPVALLVLAVSIAVKFYIYWYNRSVGKKLGSPGMAATAADSLSDCVATLVVLLSMLCHRLFHINIDGWSAAAVAVFIMYSGFSAVRGTLNPLLGSAPKPELVQSIRNIVLKHREIVNMHDLIVHDYGPGRMMISLHAEVPGDGDMCALHDTIDTVEYELSKELGCTAVIHMDPISTDDSLVTGMRETLAGAVRGVDGRISIHDFRIVAGPTHTNVIFDAELPPDMKVKDEDMKRRLEELVLSLWDNTHPKVHIDRGYAGTQP